MNLPCDQKQQYMGVLFYKKYCNVWVGLVHISMTVISVSFEVVKMPFENSDYFLLYTWREI